MAPLAQEGGQSGDDVPWHETLMERDFGGFSRKANCFDAGQRSSLNCITSASFGLDLD
jgi:hypothetical protein